MLFFAFQTILLSCVASCHILFFTAAIVYADYRTATVSASSSAKRESWSDRPLPYWHRRFGLVSSCARLVLGVDLYSVHGWLPLPLSYAALTVSQSSDVCAGVTWLLFTARALYRQLNHSSGIPPWLWYTLLVWPAVNILICLPFSLVYALTTDAGTGNGTRYGEALLRGSQTTVVLQCVVVPAAMIAIVYRLRLELTRYVASTSLDTSHITGAMRKLTLQLTVVTVGLAFAAALQLLSLGPALIEPDKFLPPDVDVARRAGEPIAFGTIAQLDVLTWMLFAGPSSLMAWIASPLQLLTRCGCGSVTAPSPAPVPPTVKRSSVFPMNPSPPVAGAVVVVTISPVTLTTTSPGRVAASRVGSSTVA